MSIFPASRKTPENHLKCCVEVGGGGGCLFLNKGFNAQSIDGGEETSSHYSHSKHRVFNKSTAQGVWLRLLQAEESTIIRMLKTSKPFTKEQQRQTLECFKYHDQSACIRN